jgi:hypothetical protein
MSYNNGKFIQFCVIIFFSAFGFFLKSKSKKCTISTGGDEVFQNFGKVDSTLQMQLNPPRTMIHRRLLIPRYRFVLELMCLSRDFFQFDNPVGSNVSIAIAT